MYKYISILFTAIVVMLAGCIDTNIEIETSLINNSNVIEDEKTETVVEDNYSITFPKNGVVLRNVEFFYDDLCETISEYSKVKLIDELENSFLIEYNGKVGNVAKEYVKYFELDKASDYTLMLDVSQFNKNSSFYSFSNDLDLGLFAIDNHINFFYIRLGGRGYGKKGNKYYDTEVKYFTDTCDYFGIPYGFYFLDEALTEEEAIDEADFITSYLEDKEFIMNQLPIAIDVEYQYGDGRADGDWPSRIPLINKLINELEKRGINSILYANGARIDTYIKDVNCNFWTAMYPRNKKIPDKFYDEIVKEEQATNLKNPEHLKDSFLSIDINMADTNKTTYSDEYLKKVVAWQFTEDGAEDDGIKGRIDLSLVDNEYFLKFVDNKE